MVLIINTLMRLGEQAIIQWDDIEEMKHFDKCDWGPLSYPEGLSTA